ncbi:TMEM165/GDT1 family protein [Anabaena subtropica]|uniref:GDT1 family protein n=1 Tax=Anabaena subtropica FACHB-260 TaxID=2692884 RepID=A0ABR8CW27_9NOST|nr:TMEM165/GDT1 family protein [Anabaena subtropica]MBD2346559.1 TMEM165/GDT1 family protein [Anabaena subtropica FACHB-260]
MKLDSAPVTLSGVTETVNQPELQQSHQSHITTAILEPVQPVVTEIPKKQESVVAVFATTFVTIFLAEIGDKTQLSTLLMSAESHLPWVVFLGSGAALITTSLLGVLLGSWVSTRFSPKILDKSAGVMLLFISLTLFWDVFHG